MNHTNCPQCLSDNTYQDGNFWICPECSYEWNPETLAATNQAEEEDVGFQVKDAHGQILQDGDSVTLVKELRIKGSSSAIKVGTKVKNIRLFDGPDGHNISCKIDGFGAMDLKSEFVKKSN